jgi:hypothetical protein
MTIRRSPMSLSELKLKARNEWYGSARLQQEYATPEYYWTLRYQRVYCPGCRADFARLARGTAGSFQS